MAGRTASLALVLLGACTGQLVGPADGGAPLPDAPSAIDARTADAARGSVDAGGEGIAPTGVIPYEVPGDDGAQEITASPDLPAVLRVDVGPTEHVTFFLDFDPSVRDVQLEVLRWDGADARLLGVTDGGRGLRTLAVVDPGGPRTFWARVTSASGLLEATLTITRVPFEDGAHCEDDCAHLLQLPLPLDPARDGYTIDGSVFRYQYGRRDLVMFLRHMGRRLASLGMVPIVIRDLSQWDGQTPGLDAGYARHGSHDRGKDVDVGLYGEDGRNALRSYCTAETTERGRECIPGTIRGFDGHANAILLGDVYASGRVSMCFLDRELIPAMIDGADEAAMEGLIEEAVVPLFADGRHLQHWPNHHNHVHIRVSEADYTTTLLFDEPPERFQAP